MESTSVIHRCKVIMVPCTWVVEAEVFIYRFRKYDNRQWDGLWREHEPIPEEVTAEAISPTEAAVEEAAAAVEAAVEEAAAAVAWEDEEEAATAEPRRQRSQQQRSAAELAS